MTVSNESIRPLIQLLAPARKLREDVEKAIHLELYEGTGDFVVRNFLTLQSSVQRFLPDDPFLPSLSQGIPDSASDKEKYAMVLFAVGQLIAYVESQVGVVGGSAVSGGGNHVYNIRPVSIGGIEMTGGSPEDIRKIQKMLSEE